MSSHKLKYMKRVVQNKESCIVTPIYSETMNMKRLMDTTIFLQFTSNEVKNDALRKIRPVLYLFPQKISDLYLPEENKALDKRLKKYMSRLPHYQGNHSIHTFWHKDLQNFYTVILSKCIQVMIL
jgi:hypothetical protein